MYQRREEFTLKDVKRAERLFVCHKAELGNPVRRGGGLPGFFLPKISLYFSLPPSTPPHPPPPSPSLPLSPSPPSLPLSPSLSPPPSLPSPPYPIFFNFHLLLAHIFFNFLMFSAVLLRLLSPKSSWLHFPLFRLHPPLLPSLRSPASPLPSKALASPRAPPMSKRSLPTSATHKSSFGILSLCFSVTVPSSLLFPFFLVLILLFFALFCCFLYSARPPVRVCFF